MTFKKFVVFVNKQFFYLQKKDKAITEILFITNVISAYMKNLCFTLKIKDLINRYTNFT